MTASGLIGRAAERQTLLDCWDRVQEGRSRVVLLSGEAGSGKTRLIEEALTEVGAPVCTGRAWPDAAVPYAALTDALREAIALDPAVLERERASALVVGALIPEAGTPPADSAARIPAALATLLSAVAQVHPLVVLLEDLHWSDSTTLEVLPRLVAHLRTSPVLFLGSYRNDEIGRHHPLRRLRTGLRRSRRLQEIELGPLSEEACAELVRSLLSGSPSPELLSSVYVRTQGVPLYVEETIDAVAGRLIAGASGLSLPDPLDVPVPESVKDAVRLRLDSLSDRARQQAEVAAIVGRTMSLSMVAEISGTDQGLDELLDHGLLVSTASGSAAFRHELIEEAVREEIPWTRRRRLHRAVAERLDVAGAEPELRAEHWQAAQEVTPAVDAWLAAAHRGCHIHAYSDAARAGRRALELWPEGDRPEQRLEALEDLARCAQLSGRLAEAVQALRELLDAEPLPDLRRAEAHRRLATILGLQGSWGASLESRERAAQAFSQGGFPGEAAVELLAAADRLKDFSRFEESIETLDRVLQLSETAERWDVMARAMALQGYVTTATGQTEEGRARVQQGLALALDHGMTEAASEAHRRLAGTFDYGSQYQAASAAYETAIDFCRSNGMDSQVHMCMGCMSWVLFQTGDWSRAQDACREVLRHPGTGVGNRMAAQGIQGLVRVLRGETRPGRKLIDQCLSRARERNVVNFELIVAWGKAEVEEQEGRLESAEAVYRDSLECWKRSQDRHDGINTLCAAASFFAGRALRRETARCVEALASIAADTGNPEALAGLSHALGESSRLAGNLREARAQFEQSATQYESLDMPYHRARASLCLGITLRGLSAGEEAAEALRTGYRLARRLGARPLAARIAAQLGELGETVEEARDAETGSRARNGGLTQRQLDVARLIAQGLTNKEIAAKLFVSTRTVDMHVRHILDRLDCRTRSRGGTQGRRAGAPGRELAGDCFTYRAPKHSGARV